MTEAQWQAQVLRVLRMYGWLVYHTHDSRRSEPGFPDLVCVHGRRGTLFAELKTATGRLSAAQQRWIDELQAAGQDVRVWRPADLPEVVRIASGQEAT